MTGVDWWLLLFLSILWGGSFFFAKVIVQEVPPLTLVLTRFALAAIALGLYLYASRLSVPASRAAWAAFTGMGALNNLIPAVLDHLEPDADPERPGRYLDRHESALFDPCGALPYSG
jgi:drug/metabolite transporter (DMT)-like permease